MFQEQENFKSHTIIYRPLVPLAGLRSRRKERKDLVFLPNRNGRFGKAIGPSGISGEWLCFTHRRIMAVFSNRPFRFEKGFAALRFNPPVSHERSL